MRRIKLKPPPPAMYNKCPDPVGIFEASQIASLDPTGARTKLFARDNPDAAKVGDIMLVRTRSGDPFAGVCLIIRRQGVDTAILLRGQLTRVGVEMWYKIYSPNVEGIEVVQRREKRARRARLYYMRYAIEVLEVVHEKTDYMLENRNTMLAASRTLCGNIKSRELRWAPLMSKVGMQTRIRGRTISAEEIDEPLLNYWTEVIIHNLCQSTVRYHNIHIPFTISEIFFSRCRSIFVLRRQAANARGS